MSFPSAMAGPSRIPMQTFARRAIPCARRYASFEAEPTGDADSPFGAPIAAPGKGRKKTTTRGKRKLLQFHKWEETAVQGFKHAPPGERAKWLGGDVPYESNRSFRPPPPLSNEVQTALAKELKKSSKTLAQISNEHGVSKARLDAIRRLKEVEAEFKRQNLPLQEAFLKGMEPLLSVQSNVESRWGRNETGDARQMSESTLAELDEEKRWDEGVGGQGAFAKRLVEPREGIERTVFEYRGEDDMLNSAKTAEGQAAAFPVPAREENTDEKGWWKKGQTVHKPELLVRRNATTSFRFTDMSSVGVKQQNQVRSAMEKRDKRRQKKANAAERLALLK